MSTILVDATASIRLARQFERAVEKGPARDALREVRRFIAYLCDRLERNNHGLMAAGRNRRLTSFQAGSAARSGESVLAICAFLLNDLAARAGRRRIAEYLRLTRTRAGRALARRIESRPNPGLRIASVRFSGRHGVMRAREVAAQAAPYAGTGGVEATFEFRGSYPGAMRIGLVLENEGYNTSHFVAVRTRLFARYAEQEPWRPTGGDAFGFLEKIPPMEAQVLAMRGFNVMELIRGADQLNRDPIAVRLLAHAV